jgi:hypothetical protein
MTRPYTITQMPVVASPLEGMAAWVRLACKHSDGCLHSVGIWVVRDQRSRPGTISNHARGLACDLSYRWQAQKNKGIKDGRKQSLAYIVKLLQNADTLGIQLVIDYALARSWKCDRGTWQAGNFESSDWWHVEIEPRLAHDPNAVKLAFDTVFGASPKASPTVI